MRATNRISGSHAFVTHRFPLGETMSGYDTFAAAAETHALKVVLDAEAVAYAPVSKDEALAILR